MIIYGEGESSQEDILYSRLVSVSEHRREGEEGARAGQLIGHCCQSNAGVTAAKALTSSDLRRHPGIQPRA